MELNLPQQTQLFADPMMSNNPNLYEPQQPSFHMIPHQTMNKAYDDDDDSDSDLSDSDLSDDSEYDQERTKKRKRSMNIQNWIPYITIALIVIVLLIGYSNMKSIQIIRKNFSEMFEESN